MVNFANVAFTRTIRRTGSNIRWDDKGNISVHRFNKDGKPDGECKEWHPNGQLRLRCFYKNGTRVGECKEWFENGQLRKHAKYKHGELWSLFLAEESTKNGFQIT